MKTFKAVKCFQNNGPEYWIVTDKAFKGTVLASCDTEEAALLIVRAVNSHESLIRAIRNIDEDLEYFDGTRAELVSRIKATVNSIIAKAEGLDKERA